MSLSISRRDFVKMGVVAGAGSTLLAGKAMGANEYINVGVIGCGNRGGGHINWINKSGGRVIAVCDPDQHRMASAAEKAASGNLKIRQYQDIRKLLEDKDIDAVVIATPNHWHATATIMACQAGKDVYVEKPVCHNIWEGHKMVEAARKYDRIVQAGTQQRSDPALITMRELIASKEIGEVQWIHSMWYRYRKPIGKVSGPQKVPSYIDYNLWSGPRREKPVMRERFHYDWHWFWPYGNGDIGNTVVHNIDDIHNVMQMGDNIPHRMMAVGGRFKYDDDAQTPNTELAVMDWKVPIIFDSRDLPFVYKDGKIGNASVYRRFGKSFRFTNIIKCEGGFFAVTRGGGNMYDNNGKRIRKIEGDGGAGHMRNFFDAVRSRKRSELNAEIGPAYTANLMMLTANISYRCGQAATPETIHKRMDLSEETREAWRQTVAHLSDNGVDLAKEKATLGPWLNFDPDSRKFSGESADKANSFVREYMRPEFSISDTV